MPDPAYAALLAKVDAFTERVTTLQSEWLKCARGCDACCRTRRTAWAVEVDALRAHVATLSEARRTELSDRRHAPDVRAGERCVFLDDDGSCAVYAARPLLCRTHGPAVRVEQALAWCALNFEGLDATGVSERVPIEGVLDLDRLNTMLALVNAQHLAAHPGPERLTLEAALERAHLE